MGDQVKRDMMDRLHASRKGAHMSSVATSAPTLVLGSGILRERSFKTNMQSLRQQSKLAAKMDLENAGFATFNAGMRAGWHEEIRSARFRQAVLAEFFATAVFVAVGLSAVLMGERPDLVLPGADDLGAPMSYDRRLLLSFTFGFMICALVFSTGGISGGNINPAVTLSLYITRKISILRCLFYVAAQCAGAVAGSAFVYSLGRDRFNQLAGGTNNINFLDPYVGTWTALGGEMMGTALLVFTVSSATDVGREKHNKFVGALTPLMIGLSVLIAHLFLLPITGCSINPARSFGPALIANAWDNHWVFWVGPLVGGPTAALLYEFVFRDADAVAAEAEAEVVQQINNGNNALATSSSSSSSSAPAPATSRASSGGGGGGGGSFMSSQQAQLQLGQMEMAGLERVDSAQSSLSAMMYAAGGGRVGAQREMGDGDGASHFGSYDEPPDYDPASGGNRSQQSTPMQRPYPPQASGRPQPGFYLASDSGESRQALAQQHLQHQQQPLASSSSASASISRANSLQLSRAARMQAAAGGGVPVANPLQVLQQRQSAGMQQQQQGQQQQPGGESSRMLNVAFGGGILGSARGLGLGMGGGGANGGQLWPVGDRFSHLPLERLASHPIMSMSNVPSSGSTSPALSGSAGPQQQQQQVPQRAGSFAQPPHAHTAPVNYTRGGSFAIPSSSARSAGSGQAQHHVPPLQPSQLLRPQSSQQQQQAPLPPPPAVPPSPSTTANMLAQQASLQAQVALLESSLRGMAQLQHEAVSIMRHSAAPPSVAVPQQQQQQQSPVEGASSVNAAASPRTVATHTGSTTSPMASPSGGAQQQQQSSHWKAAPPTIASPSGASSILDATGGSRGTSTSARLGLDNDALSMREASSASGMILYREHSDVPALDLQHAAATQDSGGATNHLAMTGEWR